MSKSKALRDMLLSNNLEFIMECHSGISAIIAEEAGFKGLWASGLSMSASTGCRDRNELSIDEVCKICEYMADHTSIPILVDGDTGGVDFNSARIMVNKLTKAGVAGVCIEDKLYPKTNSFLKNSKSDLADPQIHAGKIRAMKDENPEFVVIARLESFIAGETAKDAYDRAITYQSAGADAILVHSKKSTSEDIDEFMRMWNNDIADGKERLPIVIVPTKYYTTPTSHFRDLGISMVIWANHNMRASIKSMQDISRKIFEEESLESVEDRIVSVSEIFRLQRDNELSELEKLYSPNRNKDVTALILAGGVIEGTSTPKASVKIFGRQLLDYQENSLRDSGITDISVISDKSDKLKIPNRVKSYVNTDDNPDAKELSSISTAIDNGVDMSNVIISYGDLFFKRGIIRDLLSSNSDITILVSNDYDNDRYTEYVKNNSSGVISITDKYKEYESDDLAGTVVGVIRINKDSANIDINRYFSESYHNKYLRLKSLLNYLIGLGYSYDIVFTDKSNWVDVNEFVDATKVSDIIGG